MHSIRFFLLLLLIFSNQSHSSEPSNQPPKTILVTGAAGFIGSNFIKFMFDAHTDYHFIVIDALTYAGSLDKIPECIQNSSRFEFIHGTINKPEIVEAAMARCDSVVHFAAETHVTRSIVEDEVFFITDILGTRVLLNALKKHKDRIDRFIHISTSEVYGTAEYQPMDEDHPLNPRSPYAAAKAGADRLVYSYGCTFNVPVLILRPFNNYGPGQHLEKLIPRLITSAIKNEPMTIHGTGEQTRDWTFTSDTVQAIDRALHHPHFEQLRNQVINIGSGKTVSILEIAKMVLEHFKLPISYLEFIGDRPGQVQCHISSTEKARQLLNWTAETPLKEGIVQTIEWYIQHPHIWKKMEQDMYKPIMTTDGVVQEH